MKIDLTKINGYEKMTEIEKIKALEGYDFEPDGYVKKAVFDKTASELKDWKDKYTSTLDEAQKEKLRYQELELQHTELVKQSKISEQIANYTALGYDKELATRSAKALIEGNTEEVLACQQEYIKQIKSDFDTQLMTNTPVPKAGDKKVITRSDFEKMSYAQMLDFSKTNPAEYAEFVKNLN